MATKYSAEYSKTLEVPVRQMNSTYEGEVKFKTDTYTFTADLASTNTISYGVLPAGAKVLDCVVTWTDLDTAGGTIDVGYTGTTDGFHANLDVTSAGSARFGSTAGLITMTSQSEILVTIDGDTDATSGTITVSVMYLLD